MIVNLKGRSFLTLLDFTPEEIRYLLELSKELKARKKSGKCDYRLKDKSIVLLFEKTSTRTRCAFEVAAMEEGAHVTFLDQVNAQFGKKESLEDTAKVLGRFYHAIEYRGFGQKLVEDLAKYADVPVYNGLTDVDHPTQTLADIMTIEEHLSKPLNQVKVVFVGDISNNVSYSWMYGCAKMGMHYVAYGPKQLNPDAKAVAKAKLAAAQTGGVIEISDDVSSVKGADVIYTDVWISMGEEAKAKEKVAILSNFRVTMDLIKATGNPNVKFMHCLPAIHDLETNMARQAHAQGLDISEVTDEVFRSSHSIVFDEAENRLHTIKAILVATMGQ